jgi:hypothetical protein
MIKKLWDSNELGFFRDEYRKKGNRFMLAGMLCTLGVPLVMVILAYAHIGGAIASTILAVMFTAIAYCCGASFTYRNADNYERKLSEGK